MKYSPRVFDPLDLEILDRVCNRSAQRKYF